MEYYCESTAISDLVKKQDLGVLEEGPSNGDALLLAARKLHAALAKLQPPRSAQKPSEICCKSPFMQGSQPTITISLAISQANLGILGSCLPSCMLSQLLD